MAISFANDTENEWQVSLFDNNQILLVTTDGLINNIELPKEAQNIQTGNTAMPFALSPDQTTFAFVTETTTDDGFTSTLHIANLEEGTCCTEIPAPDGNAWEVTNLGMFSPDSRQLVINFINAYLTDSDARIAIWDVETSEYVTVINPYDVFNTNAVFFIDWHDNGLELVPTCFPCGAFPDGRTQLWNPETGEVTLDYGYNVSAVGSQLANGEIIQGAQDSTFPIGNADTIIGPFNVIQYMTEDNLDNPELVYFNPDNLNLIDSEWVIDGRAYLIQDISARSATLVWRNGESQTIEFEQQQFFLAGTPDGWLMTDTAMQQLIQYQWMDSELIMTELGTFPMLRLLQKPELGQSINEAIVPIIDTQS